MNAAQSRGDGYAAVPLLIVRSLRHVVGLACTCSYTSFFPQFLQGALQAKRFFLASRGCFYQSDSGDSLTADEWIPIVAANTVEVRIADCPNVRSSKAHQAGEEP